MFANFPGFLIADIGQRQNTNILRVPPGGSASVKTNGLPIKDAIMPLPYSTAQAPALMSLIEEMATTGMRVGGTAEQPVGEGRADAPVGTTLALIEQATKVISSVHKRMHASQAQELQLMAAVFREHPNAFWEKNKKPAYKWDEDTFLQALNDCNLIPQADPNTSSQMQRLMKLAALKQLQQASPGLYDPIAIDEACIRALGFSNPQQFMAPPSAMGKPPPELVKMQQEGQAKLQDAQSRAVMAKAKADEVKAKADIETAKLARRDERRANGKEGSEPMEAVKAKAMMLDAQTRAKLADTKQADLALNAREEAASRQSKEHLETMSLAKEVMLHHSTQAHEGALQQNDAAMQAHTEGQRMAFEDQHKSEDREAKSGLESEKLKALSKAKAAKPKGGIK